METGYDYKKFAILYVDDEELSLKYFTRAFEQQFTVLTAAGAQEGIEILQAQGDQIGLLMTDQRMPGELGVWLLERSRQLHPKIVRILVTAYADMESAIAAVNSGAIYKYITKPWDPEQLEHILKRGLEFFLVQRERDQLLNERMAILHDMMIADRIVSLGMLATGLSHHIRNSLVAIKTFLDLAPSKMREEKNLSGEVRNPEFWQEYYQNVQGQIDRINNLLHELWTASEKTSSPFSDCVQLRSLVAAVLGKLQSDFDAKNIRTENLIPEDLPEMRVDEAKFHRLFELLLKDELVSVPAGGNIRLEASATPDEIIIQVTDNGPGIPEEALRLVFDPFVVRSDSPMEFGINLMGCYFITHHHGGRIDVRNEKGLGTIFTLSFPRHPARSQLRSVEDPSLLKKIVLNEKIWDRLISSD